MFKDNPYALGYDPINEPLLADWYKNPGLWFPGQVDYYNLQTMYENFNTALRKLDQEKIVFFEPSPGDVEPYYGGLTFEAGFTQSPGGKEY